MKKFNIVIAFLLFASVSYSATDIADAPSLGTPDDADKLLTVNSGSAAGSRLSSMTFAQFKTYLDEGVFTDGLPGLFGVDLSGYQLKIDTFEMAPEIAAVVSAPDVETARTLLGVGWTEVATLPGTPEVDKTYVARDTGLVTYFGATGKEVLTGTWIPYSSIFAINFTDPGNGDAITCNDPDLASPINCGNGFTDCETTAAEGASITGITGVAAVGREWVGFTGAADENPTTTEVIVDGVENISATFQAAAAETLWIGYYNSAGTPSSTPSGISTIGSSGDDLLSTTIWTVPDGGCTAVSINNYVKTAPSGTNYEFSVLYKVVGGDKILIGKKDYDGTTATWTGRNILVAEAGQSLDLVEGDVVYFGGAARNGTSSTYRFGVTDTGGSGAYYSTALGNFTTPPATAPSLSYSAGKLLGHILECQQ